MNNQLARTCFHGRYAITVQDSQAQVTLARHVSDRPRRCSFSHHGQGFSSCPFRSRQEFVLQSSTSRRRERTSDLLTTFAQSQPPLGTYLQKPPAPLGMQQHTHALQHTQLLIHQPNGFQIQPGIFGECYGNMRQVQQQSSFKSGQYCELAGF